ncbi:unnamed protein product [Durusdinium trenchii]|uniref:Uncharacterized protein n=1 Tax=Durusdinium trenchii TaxID=1381693 RepID=A0ABP0KUT6_9DINO
MTHGHKEFQARQPIPTEAASGPEKAAPPSPRLPPALLQALAEESEYSEDEEEFRKRSEKKLKEMIASNKWRKLAEGVRRWQREKEMDVIELENYHLQEKLRKMEDTLKKVDSDSRCLQRQIQEDIRAQNRYKVELQHAQQQLETAHMETDLQRSRVADLKEMMEQLELELSFAKLDMAPKKGDKVREERGAKKPQHTV